MADSDTTMMVDIVRLSETLSKERTENKQPAESQTQQQFINEGQTKSRVFNLTVECKIYSLLNDLFSLSYFLSNVNVSMVAGYTYLS